MEPKWIAFRINSKPYIYFFGLIWGVIFLFLVTCSIFGQIRNHSFAGYLNNAFNFIVPAVGFFIVLVLTLAVTRFFFIKINDTGVEVCLFVSKRNVKWTEIESVVDVSIYGFRYVKLITKQGKHILFPREVIEKEEFKKCVCEFNGGVNPFDVR